MKLVTLLCVVSVVLNVAGGIYVATQLSDAGAGVKADGARAVDGGEMKTGLSEETRRLLAEAGTGDLATLRDRLRAEGLPESIVRDVVSGRLWTERQAKLDAADPIKKRPWWQQTREQLPGDDVRMSRLGERLRVEYQRQMDGLFPRYLEDGESADPAAAFLPVEKQQALRKLRRDYVDLNSRLGAETDNYYIDLRDAEKRTYLREEEDKDIRALLTPDEYMERKIRSVKELYWRKEMAAILDLSEHEFRELLAVDEWAYQEAKNLNVIADPFAERSPEQEALDRRISEESKRKQREAVGSDKSPFYDLWQADTKEYESISRVVAWYDLPSSRVVEYLALARETKAKRNALIRNTERPSEELEQANRAMFQDAKASLIKILGSDAAHAETELGQFIEQGLKRNP